MTVPIDLHEGRSNGKVDYRRLSPFVIHVHSSFGPPHRRPLAWRERFAYLVAACIFAVIGTVSVVCVAAAAWFLVRVIDGTLRFIHGGF